MATKTFNGGTNLDLTPLVTPETVSRKLINFITNTTQGGNTLGSIENIKGTKFLNLIEGNSIDSYAYHILYGYVVIDEYLVLIANRADASVEGNPLDVIEIIPFTEGETYTKYTIFRVLDGDFNPVPGAEWFVYGDVNIENDISSVDNITATGNFA
jgi:hypothetical protein